MFFSKTMFSKYKFVFISAVIAILLISIFVVLNLFYFPSAKIDNNISDINKQTTEQNVQQDNTAFAGDNSILFVCNDETVGVPLFALIFDFHIYSEKITVTPLDLSVSDGTRTYAEYYCYSGVDALINAVESVRNKEIDRYMIIDKKGIGDFTEALGNVTLFVAEDYTYLASDKSYEVKAGSNELESEMLFTYLKIICSNKTTMDKFTDTIVMIVNSYLEKMNENDALDLFGSICNSVTTNITISDFYSWENDIEYLLSHNATCVSYDKVE